MLAWREGPAAWRGRRPSSQTRKALQKARVTRISAHVSLTKARVSRRAKVYRFARQHPWRPALDAYNSRFGTPKRQEKNKGVTGRDNKSESWLKGRRNLASIATLCSQCNGTRWHGGHVSHFKTTNATEFGAQQPPRLFAVGFATQTMQLSVQISLTPRSTPKCEQIRPENRHRDQGESRSPTFAPLSEVQRLCARRFIDRT